MSDIAFVRQTETNEKRNLVPQYSIPKDVMNELERKGSSEPDLLIQREVARKAIAKESEYQRKRFNLSLEDKSEEGNEKKRLRHGEGETRVTKKSRWDVTESYTVPEISAATKKELTKELTFEVPNANDLQILKAADKHHFGELLLEKSDLTEDEVKDRNFLKLLLKIKNGLPSARKLAMRSLRDHAAEFGAPRIFNRLLPILLDRSLEDQERHLMIKVINRILYQLNDLVKPYTHKILIVIAPSLIDEDPFARQVARDIISRLAQAVGLPTVISNIRSDIDHEDEYVRNITSRVIAVVAKALGPNHLIPFLKAVCHSRKSWRARHTGVRSIQHLTTILGIGILPYLNPFLDCIGYGLTDEHLPVRVATAHCLASLAQSTYPYGIESYNIVLEPLWKGIRTHRGKTLASFLRALAFIIPLMDPEYAGYYSQEVMRVVKREFSSPDDEMKKAVLSVIQKCCLTEGVTPRYLRENIVPEFYGNFWTRRTALDRQISKIVTYTTVVLAQKTGCAPSISYLIDALRDESEPFRTMAVHAVNRIVKALGTQDIDERLETRLIDALLIAFQDQTNEDRTIFYGFGTVATSLDTRMKPYLPPIVSTILLRLKNKEAIIRQHAADLCAIIIPVIRNCNELEMLNKLNIILYESLGEVYPEVLGSVIGAMGQITSCIEFSKMQPTANQILPTLTPILRNRHRKVQQNSIELIGRIADRSPECVPPKEWMRICFELLEMLKSPSKSIRRIANKTFGYIARAIGPQDVLVALLNNLKVQERQLRVCTAVAIGIVAETCGTFTVLPALMNEYRTPETNVQNGVLKAMSFMFEYIGSKSKDYIYVTTPLLQDALTDRDLVHRQTAASVIRHLALGCTGMGYEDAFLHFLNLLMPNVFETSPHVIARIVEGLEALSIALGPGIAMNYVWGGLFHPAKNVRRAFWNVYNSAYVQHLDALVPCYPILRNSEERIEELFETF
ncbi:LAFE_0E13872g1_1 [Lachancea fermentati]|uniref:LAFE_0E13872g1_1 n=1 Tax=Lachancea fermentati TaxID=4955 RepID=A0A1G4ME62_LACFM|nr:LAFE_0E13872g1_1 [Lachancea fermentati]